MERQLWVDCGELFPQAKKYAASYSLVIVFYIQLLMLSLRPLNLRIGRRCCRVSDGRGTVVVHGYRAQVTPPGAGRAVRDGVYDEAGRAQPLGIVVDLAPSIRMTHSELGAGSALGRARSTWTVILHHSKLSVCSTREYDRRR